VNEKAKLQSALGGYEPVVTISSRKVNDKVEIRIKDNGNGVPQSIVDKIFQPFFTTKPTGQGQDWVCHWRMMLSKHMVVKLQWNQKREKELNLSFNYPFYKPDHA
jgi:phosphoglycerate-specific signal transduction histidine kinase